MYGLLLQQIRRSMNFLTPSRNSIFLEEELSRPPFNQNDLNCIKP